MITLNSKPREYIPFETLTVCSNTVKGGGNLVAVGDTLPLLVGKGDIPQIWLLALADAKTNSFIPIVEKSVSKHPAVKVYEERGVLNVMISGEIVLSVRRDSESSASVTKLDFRPLGLNMHGNEKSLQVGGGSFSGNSMAGGGTLIGLGTPSSNK
jgi:hypothetical protein